MLDCGIPSIRAFVRLTVNNVRNVYTVHRKQLSLPPSPLLVLPEWNKPLVPHGESNCSRQERNKERPQFACSASPTETANSTRFYTVRHQRRNTKRRTSYASLLRLRILLAADTCPFLDLPSILCLPTKCWSDLNTERNHSIISRRRGLFQSDIIAGGGRFF